MSLLSEDISKLNKLSIQELKLPAPKVKIEPMDEEYPPTEEEIAYSKIIAINPLIEDLVRGLEIVSSKTGEQIKSVKRMYQLKLIETVSHPQLLVLAQRIISKEETYTKQEVIKRLRDEAKVSQERAKTGFCLMIKAGVIEPTKGGGYCLTGSAHSKHCALCNPAV